MGSEMQVKHNRGKAPKELDFSFYLSAPQYAAVLRCFSWYLAGFKWWTADQGRPESCWMSESKGYDVDRDDSTI